MPKINVYLPDALAERVRTAGLPVSAICQAALSEALALTVSWEEAVTEKSDLPEQIAFDRPVTKHLANALTLSHALARSRDNDELTTEHLLLGLVEEGENLALKVLEAASINQKVLVKKLKASLPSGDPGSADLKVGLSPAAERAIDWSAEEAAGMSRPFIGSEHLLLGLLRDETGGAGRVLRKMGLEIGASRTAIRNMLTGSSFGHWNTAAIQQVSVERRLADLVDKVDWIYASMRKEQPGTD